MGMENAKSCLKWFYNLICVFFDMVLYGCYPMMIHCLIWFHLVEYWIWIIMAHTTGFSLRCPQTWLAGNSPIEFVVLPSYKLRLARGFPSDWWPRGFYTMVLPIHWASGTGVMSLILLILLVFRDDSFSFRGWLVSWFCFRGASAKVSFITLFLFTYPFELGQEYRTRLV